LKHDRQWAALVLGRVGNHLPRRQWLAELLEHEADFIAGDCRDPDIDDFALIVPRAEPEISALEIDLLENAVAVAIGFLPLLISGFVGRRPRDDDLIAGQAA